MKSVLITGVSRGNGRTLAQHFHILGFHIYGVYKWSDEYRHEEVEANRLAEELKNLTLLPFDLADR
jgi:NAD(P)-dependent dehydrogenase (short-subunit alcohol dehydrogenase family)